MIDIKVLKPNKKRRDSRHTIQLNVELEVFDYNGNVEAKENSVTENISHHGASVFTALKIGRGRAVKLTSLESGISAKGIVHSRRKGQNGVFRLHIEFVDFVWPIDGID